MAALIGSAVVDCLELLRSTGATWIERGAGSLVHVRSGALDVSGLTLLQQFRQEMQGGTDLGVTREDFLAFVLVQNGRVFISKTSRQLVSAKGHREAGWTGNSPPNLRESSH